MSIPAQLDTATPALQIATAATDRTFAAPAAKQEFVDYEKRFKDTQGAYTKSQQALKDAEARLAAADAKIKALDTVGKPTLSADVLADLDDLKHKDPDKWRVKLNRLEGEARAKRDAEIAKIEKAAHHSVELANRTEALAEFHRQHPDIVLTDDVIKYDVPPRLTNRLESGEISFDNFLQEAANFIQKPKVIGDGNSLLGQPNLTNIGGGSAPTETATHLSIEENYANIVF